MQDSQYRKYGILVNILDKYVKEGSFVKQRKSQFDTSTEEKENQARARAFIHLYLAATYGILDFEEREHSITDASYDGGIDAYYINSEDKIIEVIQSKFRVGPTNFESKHINPEELLAVDLNRILEGNREDATGTNYNGYILAFIEKIQKIADIARYKTKVTILANVKLEQYALVERLFSGDQINIVNFDRCYAELVVPTIRGEQHYTSSMRLQIDLSNKSNSSRLSAEILTAHGPSELTVVLVPTLEIAKIITRYKNSILRYNPRSYLEFKEQRTNEGIMSSITDVETGEFAILNNGITIVSDDTYVNHRVGSKNKAQVEIVNPQIINGGQTAFTLGRIYEETAHDAMLAQFSGKEVVLRIITLPQISEDAKKELIMQISSATNSQTTVAAVDRTASNDDNRVLAERVFRKTGLLYEPKRGEYADALRNGYIEKNDIIERALFSRIMHIACGRYELALEKRMMRSTGGVIPGVTSDDSIDRFYELFLAYREISLLKITSPSDKVISDLALTVFVCAYRRRMIEDGQPSDLWFVLEQTKKLYPDFIDWARQEVGTFMMTKFDKNIGKTVQVFSSGKWKKSSRYPNDVETYISLLVREERPVPENVASIF